MHNTCPIYEAGLRKARDFLHLSRVGSTCDPTRLINIWILQTQNQCVGSPRRRGYAILFCRYYFSHKIIRNARSCMSWNRSRPIIRDLLVKRKFEVSIKYRLLGKKIARKRVWVWYCYVDKRIIWRSTMAINCKARDLISSPFTSALNKSGICRK